MNNRRSKSFLQRPKDKSVMIKIFFNISSLSFIQFANNLDIQKKAKGSRKNEKDRFFGKDIGNEINNINKNISSILDKLKKAKNLNMVGTKGGNNINNNYEGKENKSFILNRVKKIENKVNNNINVLKNKDNKNQENIRQDFNKKNLLNKNKIIFDKIEYKKNPLDEYDDSIMKNLFLNEIKNRPNYRQYNQVYTEKDILTRITSINFIISISETFNLEQETIYLAINIYDRCFPKLKNYGKPVSLKVFDLSCIFIASKYEEIYPPLLEDYSELVNFSRQEIFKLENFILSTINFELHICSPYLFLTKFFHSNSKIENTLILSLAQYILDLSSLSLEFCAYKPSFQAVICLYLSRYIYYKYKIGVKPWTKDDEFITGYSENEIKKNIKLSCLKIKEIYNGNLAKDFIKSAIYKKYSSDKYLSVAKRFRNLF